MVPGSHEWVRQKLKQVCSEGKQGMTHDELNMWCQVSCLSVCLSVCLFSFACVYEIGRCCVKRIQAFRVANSLMPRMSSSR